MSKLIKSFEEIIHFTEKGEAFFKLFKLLSTLIFIIHLLACLWNAVAYYSPYDKTILNFNENTLNNPKFWYNDYISCIYWSISYGKVNPQNSLEHAFGALAVFIYQIASAFIIGGILNILKILSHKENEKK